MSTHTLAPGCNHTPRPHEPGHQVTVGLGVGLAVSPRRFLLRKHVRIVAQVELVAMAQQVVPHRIRSAHGGIDVELPESILHEARLALLVLHVLVFQQDGPQAVLRP